MKTSKCKKQRISKVVKYASLCVVAGLLLADQKIKAANMVVRHFSGVYTPGVPLTVSISVNLDSGCVWALEDAPPAGWAVGNISDDGAFDSINGKVKFGIFFDGPACGGMGTNVSRVLSYTLVPPPDETGTKSFFGVWSVDGSVGPIGGNAQVESDADNVGGADASEHCPGTPPDSITDGNGCGIDQLVPCIGPTSGGTWKNHGEYVLSVSKVVDDLFAKRLITKDQKNAMIVSAARSNCGTGR
jgi:hypothetical protein